MHDSIVILAVAVPTLAWLGIKLVENYFEGKRIEGRIKQNMQKIEFIEKHYGDPRLNDILDQI